MKKMETNKYCNLQKCGEIFIDKKSKDKNKVYIFHCAFCNIELEHITNFSFHIEKEHLNLEDVESQIKMEIEPEEMCVEAINSTEVPDLGSIGSLKKEARNENPDHDFVVCNVKHEPIDNSDEQNIFYYREVIDDPPVDNVKQANTNVLISDNGDEHDIDQLPLKKIKLNFDGESRQPRQKAIANVSSDESKDAEYKLLATDFQSSRAVLKYQKDAKKCINCDDPSINLQSLQDTLERQNKSIIDILAQHEVLLSKIISHNKAIDDIIKVFPIKSEEKLCQVNALIQSQADPYLRHMKSLLKGNVGRYLNEILELNIIHEFNVDGTHGKQSLRKFEDFYSALIGAIASFEDEPDAALRKAFQLQKKRIFRANRVEKLQKKEMPCSDNETSTTSEFFNQAPL